MAVVSSMRLLAGELRFGEVTHVMSVINLSPESKNTRTIASSADDALEMARRHRDMGVSIVDLGGQSSHYDNPTIAVTEELDRLVPAVDLLVEDGFIVSVDTWKPEVARVCVDRGAAVVNDTGGLADPDMRAVAATPGVASVVMYIEGSNPHDVGEIEVSDRKGETTAAWLKERLARLAEVGITDTMVDPGISINYRGDYDAYTRMQLEVIRSTAELKATGRPVLVPIPRKREDHRVAAYVTMALEYEADVIRVHDVAEACDLVRLFGRSV